MQKFNLSFNKFFIFFMVFFILISMSCVSANETFADVKSSVNSAHVGDTVYLNNTTYDGNGSLMYLNKKVITITGASENDSESYSTLDAHSLSSIFYFAPNTNVTLKNLILKNGNYSSGGAIGIGGGCNLTLINCIFINNFAKNNGGALNGNNITINNCTFINNSANSSAGAIYGKNNTISNSVFINNSAKYGGVLSGESSTIIGSTFNNNSAERGGVIYGKDYNINNSTFNNNFAKSGGVLEGGNSDINNSIFNGNSAEYGGVIFGDNTTVNTSVFINNSASKNGGAIMGKKGTISNSVFINNSANWHGGAICSIGNLTVDGSEFINNSAHLYGGAIVQFYNSTVDISSSNFTANGAMYGGAVNVGEGLLNIDNSNFNDNKARFYGGAISTQGNITIKDSLLNNNVAIEGNDISLCNVSNNDIEKINTEISDKNIKNWNKTLINNFYGYESELGDSGDYPPMINASDYIYFTCTEPMVPVGPEDFTRIYNTSNIYNKFDDTQIGEYLKILAYMNINRPGGLNITSDCITIFSHPDYRDSDNEYVKEVLNLYDSGFRVPDHAILPFNDTHKIVIDFLELFSSVNQNHFAYNFSFIEIEKDITVNKTTSNKTVHIGDQVIFNISVTNGGNVDLDNVYVVESKYDGLKYVGFVDKTGLWIHSIKDGKHLWTLNKTLAVNETLGFSVLFEAVKSGNLTNMVIAGFENVTVNATANVTVEKNSTGTNGTGTNGTGVSGNKTKHSKGFGEKPLHTKLYNTGNPLFLSVLALISVCLVSLRRRK